MDLWSENIRPEPYRNWQGTFPSSANLGSPGPVCPYVPVPHGFVARSR